MVYDLTHDSHMFMTIKWALLRTWYKHSSNDKKQLIEVNNIIFCFHHLDFFNFIYLFFFNLSLHLLYSGLDISEIFAKKGGKNDFFFKKLLYKRRVENFKLLGFEPLFSDYFANHLKFHIISILLYLAKISTLT